MTEREAIVAWLREQAAGFDAMCLFGDVWMGDFLRQKSYQIERGDHRKDEA
jgi:hypothetical protein